MLFGLWDWAVVCGMEGGAVITPFQPSFQANKTLCDSISFGISFQLEIPENKSVKFDSWGPGNLQMECKWKQTYLN